MFANNGCSGCHTLAAANAGGTTGPDLDKALPGQSAAEITQSIVDPNAKITPGYPANVMPQNFKTLIPPAQLTQLVQYLISSTGGAKASGKQKKKQAQLGTRQLHLGFEIDDHVRDRQLDRCGLGRRLLEPAIAPADGWR